ncbi:MAG: hypothetical protein ACI4NJ_02935 [Cellvibrio sp.]
MKNNALIGFFIFLFFSMVGCNLTAEDSVHAKYQGADEFISAILSSDREKLDEMMSDDGLLICRIFVSGNLGGRGEDSCSNYKVGALKFDEGVFAPVTGQTDISLNWLFSQSITQIKTSAMVFFESKNPIAISSPHKTATELVELLQGVKQVLDGEPVMLGYSNGNYMLLEVQLIDDVLVGGMAFFETVDGVDKLVAIYDLR